MISSVFLSSHVLVTGPPAMMPMIPCLRHAAAKEDSCDTGLAANMAERFQSQRGDAVFFSMAWFGGYNSNMYDIIYWLVVLTILKNMEVNGKDYPIYYGNKCSKPPTSIYIHCSGEHDSHDDADDERNLQKSAF